MEPLQTGGVECVALGVLLFPIAILDTGGGAEVRWCAIRCETCQETLACTGGMLKTAEAMIIDWRLMVL
jgi:hypothetical protein